MNIISSTVKHLPIISKVLMMVATAALIPLMFPTTGGGEHYDYTEGGIWRNADLYAPYDFDVLKNADELARETEAAHSRTLLFYHTDSTAHSQAIRRLDGVARRHHEAFAQQGPRYDHALRRRIDSIYRVGYIELPDLGNYGEEVSTLDWEGRSIVLLTGNVGSERVATEFVTPYDIEDSLLRDSILIPSIVFDAERTKIELDSRLSLIAVASDRLSQGDLVIAKGEFITAEKAQILRSLEAENQRRFHEHYSPFGRFFGQFMLCVISYIALYMFLKNTRHKLLEDNRKVLFVLLLSLLMSAVTSMVLQINPELVLIVPICIVPIMMRIFFDMRVALYVHVTTIVILANMVPNPFEYIFYQLIAGMMSIVTVRNFENRSKFFVVSGVIFVTYALIYTFGVLSQESTLQGITGQRYLIFFLNAILTLLAYPLIYIFERLFGLTTNLTLMELSSTNTPALRELSRSAPGTFQHSMQVANISEDIISEIGGNPLLAKVGGLYHDIGKVQAPLYFTENQTGDFNPHNELDYTESARIIIEHVHNGLQLARKYHLPSSVADFIRTHHGTTMTGYFYAKQKSEHPDQPISVTDFQYPGPMPYNRETAVVMLVDSVEAACKSLKNHDKEHIDKLVDHIINGKVDEHQLQNCDLTFGDLTRIRILLKQKMLSIYHARISYPVMKSEKQE